MFTDFETFDLEVNGVTIHLRKGGQGEPLLLLHGYPQTHVMWHKIAPQLAEHFTVVIPDLRGYGDSSKPATTPDHAPYSKRAMATDMAELMTALGFEQFMVAGHDRGARVTHRLALDYATRVKKAAVLDIAPTYDMYTTTDMELATAYYHWFFLIQPYDIPEKLLGNDPEWWIRKKLAHWSRTATAFTPEATDEYIRCFSNPSTIHATCEDYRASATIDLQHDAADRDRKVTAPLLVLWGQKGFVSYKYNMPGIWQERAEQVIGKALPCGHFLPEEAPAETLAELLAFFQN